jgi:hypothetical protein
MVAQVAVQVSGTASFQCLPPNQCPDGKCVEVSGEFLGKVTDGIDFNPGETTEILGATIPDNWGIELTQCAQKDPARFSAADFGVFDLLAADGKARLNCPSLCNSTPSPPPDPRERVIGNWTLVNFLATDDNGVWGEDNLDGIGVVASISETQWVETNTAFDVGCTVTLDYSVDGNGRYSKIFKSFNDKCGFPVDPTGRRLTGVLEFTDGGNFMNDYFDLQPGDTLAAWRYIRR